MVHLVLISIYKTLDMAIAKSHVVYGIILWYNAVIVLYSQDGLKYKNNFQKKFYSIFEQIERLNFFQFLKKIHRILDFFKYENQSPPGSLERLWKDLCGTVSRVAKFRKLVKLLLFENIPNFWPCVYFQQYA